MDFDAERVRANVHRATTEDLLDRITAYRAGMEAEAVEIIEEELRSRDVDEDAVEAHAAQRGYESIPLPDGTVVGCSFCYRPAVKRGWGWHWLSLMVWGRRRSLVPLFPRRFAYCAEHEPGAPPPDGV